MKPMTCDQIAAQIDLHAAGESTPGIARDIDRHLNHCAACQAEFDRAAELMARLDWHHREPAALDRLLTKLHQQPQKRRFHLQPWARRAAALAACFVVLSLLGLYRPAPQVDAGPTVVAWLEAEPQGRAIPQFPPHEMARLMHAKEADIAVGLERDGPLQLLPVDLSLRLDNPENQTLYLHPDDPRTRLLLILDGPAVKRQQPGPGAVPPALTPRRRVLVPGGSTTLTIPWLIDGTARHPRYLFCAEPGTYTLTIQYRVPVSYKPDDPGEPRTFSSRPLKLRVAPR